MGRSLRLPAVGSARPGRLTVASLVGALLVVSLAPSGVALPSGCGLISSFLPGSPDPSATFPLGLPPSETGGNVTNGEVEALFDQVCGEPAFEGLAHSQRPSNFTFQVGGNAQTGQVTLYFGFQWVAGCPSSYAARPCSILGFWSAFPRNDTVSGPTVQTGPLACACGAAHATPTTGLGSLGGGVGVAVVGGAASAVIVVGFVAQRRRNRRPPPGGPAGPASPSAGEAPAGGLSAPARTARP